MAARVIYSKVHGVSRGNRQKLIGKFCEEGMELRAVREPRNRHDENAVALYLEHRAWFFFRTESQIGYLSAELAEELAPFLDRGNRLVVRVANVTGGDGRFLGVNISIERRARGR